MSTEQVEANFDEQLQRRRVERLLVNAVWLVRLRWVAVAGQSLTIGVAAWALHVKLQLTPLLAILALTAITNLVFSVWFTRQFRVPSDRINGRRLLTVMVAVMTLDLLSLTVLLYFSGGTTNPFTIFYFVNLALAAVVLPARWSWTLTAISLVCLAGLFLLHVPLDDLDNSVFVRESTGENISLRQFGLGVALAACAVVVVYFITRVTRELRMRERQLRNAEQQRSRAQRLEALGTLAAGAGHELATPLSTIAVVSKELTRHLEGVAVPPSVLEDVTLIRAEVDRCRTILDRMSGSLGRNKDEPAQRITAGQIVEDVLNGLADPQRVNVRFRDGASDRQIEVPHQSFAQAIRGIVQNALDASTPDQPVEISVRHDGEQIRLEIRDRGEGMSDEVFSRAGEPFFTTKEPGKGMGLGLFLTRSVVERLGGSLELHSPQGDGVSAVVRIPKAD